MKHFLDLTIMTTAEERLKSLNNHSLVIYSPTSLRLINVTPRNGTFISTHDIGKDVTNIERFFATRRIETVLGFGGGTAIDIAKYIASLTNCKFICIPIMLSTNAFATDKVSLMRNGSSITLGARLADEIILDQALLSKARAYNLYGLCDVLSIHTALYDWFLADKAGVEKIDYRLYRLACKLLSSAIRLALESKEPGRQDMLSLFSLIGESGHITNIHGTGRPESGSEHIFAKELERRTKVPHGISIATGIALMSQLQDNYSADVQEALQQIGIMDDVVENYDLREDIILSLRSLLPRKDRYTILNEKLPTASDSRMLTDMLYKETIGAVNEYSYR